MNGPFNEEQTARAREIWGDKKPIENLDQWEEVEKENDSFKLSPEGEEKFREAARILAANAKVCFEAGHTEEFVSERTLAYLKKYLAK